MKARIFCSSILLILLMPFSVLGQGDTYYPLQVGNFWQYNFQLPFYSSYSITRAGVVDSLLIDGDLWYTTYLHDINCILSNHVGQVDVIS